MSISDDLRAPIVVNPVRWEAASGGFVPNGAICGGKTFSGELLYIGRTKLKENQDELTPGVLIPSEGCLMVSFGTGVRKSVKYEVLVTSDPCFVRWVSCKHGPVPPTAVIGGIDSSYLEPLYIGKTTGDLLLGRTWRGQRFPDKNSEPTQHDTKECSVADDQDRDGDECLREESSKTLLSGYTDPACTTKIRASYPGKIHLSHKCLYIPYDDKEYLYRNFEVLTLTSSPAALTTICKCLIRDHIFSVMQERKAREAQAKIRRQRRSSSMLVPGTDDFNELEERINLLPLPSKLKQFCKQGAH